MSSLSAAWLHFTVANALHVLGIFLLAFLLNHLLRGWLLHSLAQPKEPPARSAQGREQQSRALADTVYRLVSKVVWAIATLTALPEFGINVLPVVLLAAAISIGLGLGAQNIVRDCLAGLHIQFEDQFATGETIQVGDLVGRVELLTLRRTMIRDTRGALLTIPNGDIRCVGNLSRDWSQAFVDVRISPAASLEKVIQALEAAAAGLRTDPVWAQALVDGPRVLGLQDYAPAASTLRMQVRTTPTRQDEVARELRRRIHIEFQRQSIPGAALRNSAIGSLAESDSLG